MSDNVKGLNTGVWLSEMWQRLIPWAKALEAQETCLQKANEHVGESRFSSGEKDISPSKILPGVFFVDLKSDLQKKMYCEVSCDEKEAECRVKLKETLDLPVIKELSDSESSDVGMDSVKIMLMANPLFAPIVGLSLLGGCSVTGPAIQDSASQSEDSVQVDVDVAEAEISYDGDVSKGDAEGAEGYDDDLKAEDANSNGADDVIEEIDAAIAELDAAENADETSQADETGDVPAEDQSDPDSMVYDEIPEITFSDPANAPSSEAEACGFNEMPTEWQVLHVKQDGVTYNVETGGIPASVLMNEPDQGVVTSILLYSAESGFTTCDMEYSDDPVGTRWTLSGDSCFDGYENMTLFGIYYSAGGSEAVYLELEGSWQAGATTCMSTFMKSYEN